MAKRLKANGVEGATGKPRPMTNGFDAEKAQGFTASSGYGL